MKKAKPWILALAAIALAFAAVFLGRRYWPRPQPVTYQTVPAQKQRIAAKVTASGTLSALVTVLVGTQVSGRILEINVDFNSPVKKGEILAKLDPQLFQAAVAQSRANYAAAKGGVAKAEANAVNMAKQYARSKELIEKNLIAQADLDTAEAAASSANADIVAAKGSLEQAEASLKQANINLTYTTIISPVNGIVISRAIDVGQTVAASLAAPTLFTIAEDLAKMQVDTSVAEADVGKLTPGMQSTFTVDAYPNEQFRGSVRQIRNAPQTLQNVVTYDAVVDVDNAALKLKPGMTANVVFVYADRENVLSVPNAALRFRPSSVPATSNSGPTTSPGGANAAWAANSGGEGSSSPAPAHSGHSHGGGQDGSSGREGPRAGGSGGNNRKAVWVLRMFGQVERVPVKTGVSDGTVTEVLDGTLQEGDQVIIDEQNPADSHPPAQQQQAPPGGNMRRIL